MTLNQIIDRLRNEEETSVLELLDIKTDDLVDMFQDKIEDRKTYLEKEFGED